MNNGTINLYSSVAKLGFMLLVMFGASQAMAAPTAANAILENTATANFDNLVGVPQTAVTVTATITVLLTPTTPTLTLSSTAPTDLSTLAEGQDIDIFYQVTSNANGPDNYNLIISENALTDLATGTFTTPTDIGILGATTIVQNFTILNTGGAGAGECSTPDGGTGVCALRVANDGASNASVNGLVGGDTVVLTSGLVCTVDSVDDTNGGVPTDPSVGTGFSLVTVEACSGSGLQSVGDGIFERRIVQFDYTTGNLTASPTPGTATISTVARDDAAAAAASAAVNSPITVLAARIVIHKLVRNVTDPVVGDTVTDPGNDVNGNQVYGVITVDPESGGGPFTYYKAGVTAEPGDTLQYIIVVENVGATVTDVVVDDEVTIFTTYTATSIRLMEEGDVDSCTDAWNCTILIDTTPTPTVLGPLNDAVNGDEATQAGGVITIYAGIGGSDAGTGGTIAPDKVTVGFYQVTVE